MAAKKTAATLSKVLHGMLTDIDDAGSYADRRELVDQFEHFTRNLPPRLVEEALGGRAASESNECGFHTRQS